ncbi:MAG TPA: gfo/Idh/MocA family oxidoreductase [Ruminococcaceae bacterium]|nr:gfo/Idh/MocA family oxidoreductase [Oscillospiraceae bacterium]
MKITIIGASGHSAAAIQAVEKFDDVKISAYCPSFEGEAMARLEKAFSELGVSPAKYDDWQKMLDDEAPDIVIVDGIFSSHAKMAEYALNKNINVYCEKPAATETGELADLIKASLNSKGLYWGMFTARYESWFYTAKKLVEQGAIGKIRLLNGQKSYKLGKRQEFYKSAKTYGGTIPWVAIHSLDMIFWLTGLKCKSVYAQQSSACNNGHGDLETTALINLELEDNVLASVTADYYRPDSAVTHGDDRIRVVGTEGVLEVRDSQVYLINRQNDGTSYISQHPLETLIFEDFINAVNGGGKNHITAKSSLYSAYVALMARQSCFENKKLDLNEVVL